MSSHIRQLSAMSRKMDMPSPRRVEPAAHGGRLGLLPSLSLVGLALARPWHPFFLRVKGHKSAACVIPVHPSTRKASYTTARAGGGCLLLLLRRRLGASTFAFNYILMSCKSQHNALLVITYFLILTRQLFDSETTVYDYNWKPL